MKRREVSPLLNFLMSVESLEDDDCSDEYNNEYAVDKGLDKLKPKYCCPHSHANCALGGNRPL
jgi:hypothetical protein